MKLTERFKQWYNTDGVRTPVYPTEGITNHHEEYQKLAYFAGYKAAIDYCAAVVDKVGIELGKTS